MYTRNNSTKSSIYWRLSVRTTYLYNMHALFKLYFKDLGWQKRQNVYTTVQYVSTCFRLKRNVILWTFLFFLVQQFQVHSHVMLARENKNSKVFHSLTPVKKLCIVWLDRATTKNTIITVENIMKSREKRQKTPAAVKRVSRREQTNKSKLILFH